jgi:hypothetical protein
MAALRVSNGSIIFLFPVFQLMKRSRRPFVPFLSLLLMRPLNLRVCAGDNVREGDDHSDSSDSSPSSDFSPSNDFSPSSDSSSGLTPTRPSRRQARRERTDFSKYRVSCFWSLELRD